MRRVFASAFAPVWGSGLTLSVCIFLPMCLIPGCQGRPATEFYPCDTFEGVKSLQNVLGAAIITWPYVFGIIVFAATLLISATCSAKHFRTLWFVYAAGIVVMSIALWFATGEMAREIPQEEDPVEFFEQHVWMIVPTVLLCILLVATYFNCRTWFAAALWMQLALALTAMGWFLLAGIAFELASGGKLSLAASAVLALATLWERKRGLATLGIRPP